jgi:hypothetical protein
MLGLFIALVIVGAVLYLVNAYVPMAAPIKTILNIVVIVMVLLWVLSAFGVIAPGVIPTPRWR